jgi:hypothetical protein
VLQSIEKTAALRPFCISRTVTARPNHSNRSPFINVS